MGLLKELKMLDLSRLLPGPYCSLLLADLGMEVLKVEDPEQGDYMRKMGPVRKKDSAYFLALNRNKKSMTLNLKVKEGKEIFYKLIETYDIVLEGFQTRGDGSPWHRLSGTEKEKSPCDLLLPLRIWTGWTLPRKIRP